MTFSFGMTKRATDRFLSLPHIAKLATVNPNGSPQISPVWFYWRRNQVLISTFRQAVKVRNIKRNSSVSILIDSENGGLNLQGVLRRGRGVLAEGSGCGKIVTRIYEKYLPPRIVRKDKVAGAYKRAAISDGEAYVCIKVIPSTISSWNYSRLTNAGVIALTESTRPYDRRRISRF